jgi:hypothetical protein
VDEEAFWEIIGKCRTEGGAETELVSRVLFRRLRALDAAAVARFIQLWERARSQLHSWPMTDAACLLLGRVEEEDLDNIYDWVISHGRVLAARVLDDPDNLVDLAADVGSARADWFDEFMTEAHITVTGTWPLGFDPDGPDEMVGEHTDLADRDAVNKRFPRLAAFRRHHPKLAGPQLC